MTRKLFLHVGLPKTGTTSMQKWFLENRDALALRGLTYPVVPPLQNWKQGYTVQAFRSADFTPIKAALQQCETSNLLLSNEGLSNHFHDFPAKSLTEFRRLASDIEIVLICFFRNAEQWLRSYHRQAVLNPRNNASELWGTSQSASEIRGHYRVQRLLDHERLADDMAKGFGAAATHLLDFDGTEAFVKMLQILGQEELSDIPLPRVNVSIPEWAIEMLRNINASVPDEPTRRPWKALLFHYLSSNHTVLRDAANGLDRAVFEKMDLSLLEKMPMDVPRQAISKFHQEKLPLMLKD